MFELATQLQQDTFYIASLPLCEALLMNDARYPWVILVPRKQAITEIFQLSEQEQQQLTKESSFIAETLSKLVSADKMNVAALGNVVSQLHIHYVARYQHDETWPAPVWGKGVAVPYNKQELQAVLQQLQQAISEFNHGDNLIL